MLQGSNQTGTNSEISLNPDSPTIHSSSAPLTPPHPVSEGQAGNTKTYMRKKCTIVSQILERSVSFLTLHVNGKHAKSMQKAFRAFLQQRNTANSCTALQPIITYTS